MTPSLTSSSLSLAPITLYFASSRVDFTAANVPSSSCIERPFDKDPDENGLLGCVSSFMVCSSVCGVHTGQAQFVPGWTPAVAARPRRVVHVAHERRDR